MPQTLPRITHHVGRTYRCDALTGHPRLIGQVTRLLFQAGHRSALLIEDGEEILISVESDGWMEQPFCPIQPNHPAYAGRATQAQQVAA